MSYNLENKENALGKKIIPNVEKQEFKPGSFEMNKEKLLQVANYDINKPEQGRNWSEYLGLANIDAKAKTINDVFNSVVKQYNGVDKEALAQVFKNNKDALIGWIDMAGKSSMTEVDIKKLDAFSKKIGTEIYPLVKSFIPDTNINANKEIKDAGYNMDAYAKIQDEKGRMEISKNAHFLNSFSDGFMKDLSNYGVAGNNVYEKYSTYKAKQQGGYSQYDN